MKGSRFTEEQIIGILREQESGSKTADVCRKHGVSEATFVSGAAATHGGAWQRYDASVPWTTSSRLAS